MIKCTIENNDMYKSVFWENVLFLDDCNTFITICSEKDAEFKFNDETMLCLTLQKYDEESRKTIIEQANRWTIKIVRTEDWDPSFGYNQGKVVKEKWMDILPQMILVKDGSFAGVITYSHQNDSFVISCELVEHYSSEPLLFSNTFGFGSSDHDMFYTEDFYLLPKTY